MLEIIAVTFLATITLLGGIYQTQVAARQKTLQRLTAYTQESSKNDLVTPGNETDWRNLLAGLSKYVSKMPKAEDYHIKMQQAGIPLKGAEFLILAGGLSVIACLLTIILIKGNVLAGLVVGLLSYLLFRYYVTYKINKRLVALNNQLGDALALMANALRSGLSFLQAIEVISREMTNPIAGEFSTLLKEMRLGVTTEEALRNLAIRVPSNDLDLVVTSVLIQRQVGGNLAIILDTIGATVRERLKMKGEIRTLTAPGRLSGWIVGLLPIVMVGVMWLINREYMMLLFTERLGQMLLVCAVVLQLIGALIIRNIIDIDV